MQVRIKWKLFQLLMAWMLLVTVDAKLLYANTNRHVFVGAGIISQDAGKLSNNSNGGTSLTSALYSQVALTGIFKFGSSWGWSPVINYTPLGYKSPDEKEKFSLLTGAIRLFRKFGFADLRLGPGVIFYTISGSGDTVTLNNGNGTTLFGTPSTSATARMFTLTGGVGLSFSRFRLDFDGVATTPFSARLAWNFLSTLSVGLF